MGVIADAQSDTLGAFAATYGAPPDTKTAILAAAKLICRALGDKSGLSNIPNSTSGVVSGVIAANNVGQEVLSSNALRGGFEFFNCSTTKIMWIYFGSDPNPEANGTLSASGRVGIPILPYGSYSSPSNIVPNGYVWVASEDGVGELFSYVEHLPA